MRQFDESGRLSTVKERAPATPGLKVNERCLAPEGIDALSLSRTTTAAKKPLLWTAFADAPYSACNSVRALEVLLANLLQPKYRRLCNLKRIDLAHSHNRSITSCSLRLRRPTADCHFYLRSNKKLSVREFLGSASSLPQCIAFDSRRLTLLPAIEGQGEGASPCFLLPVIHTPRTG